MRRFPLDVTQEGAAQGIQHAKKQFMLVGFYELFSLDEIRNKVRVYNREWVALHISPNTQHCSVY